MNFTKSGYLEQIILIDAAFDQINWGEECKKSTKATHKKFASIGSEKEINEALDKLVENGDLVVTEEGEIRDEGKPARFYRVSDKTWSNLSHSPNPGNTGAMAVLMKKMHLEFVASKWDKFINS